MNTSAFNVVHKSLRTPEGIIRFRTLRGTTGGFDGRENRVEAMLKQKNIGYLSLRRGSPLEGMVDMVKTRADHRRKGVATGMWRQAQKVGLNPKHSTIRSEAGDAWAKKVGGRHLLVPRLANRLQTPVSKFSIAGIGRVKRATLTQLPNPMSDDVSVANGVLLNSKQRMEFYSNLSRLSNQKRLARAFSPYEVKSVKLAGPAAQLSPPDVRLTTTTVNRRGYLRAPGVQATAGTVGTTALAGTGGYAWHKHRQPVRKSSQNAKTKRARLIAAMDETVKRRPNSPWLPKMADDLRKMPLVTNSQLQRDDIFYARNNVWGGRHEPTRELWRKREFRRQLASRKKEIETLRVLRDARSRGVSPPTSPKVAPSGGRKALIVGGAALGTGLAGYGGAKYIQHRKRSTP